MDALIELALAAPDTPEIEPKHGKPQPMKGVMQVVDDLVVHRPAELRMRVHDQRDGRVVALVRVVAALKPPVGAGEDHFGHAGSSKAAGGAGCCC